MRLPLRAALYLVLDCFLLTACFVNAPTVIDRPGPPFEVAGRGEAIVVSTILDSSASAGVEPGDSLLSWNRKSIDFAEVIEYLADRSTIGSPIALELLRNGVRQSVTVSLIPFYSSVRFLVISLFVGLTVFAVGVFILLARPGDPAARTLHWALVTLGTTMMITWGRVEPGSLETAVLRSVWFTSYLGVAVSFFFFTLVFPRNILPRIERYAGLLVGSVITLGIAFGLSHVGALASGSVKALDTFQGFFDAFHASLFLFVGGGLITLARGVFSIACREERQKLYWILWGLSIGVLPYLVIHILPQLILSRTIVAEEFTTVFFLAVPLGFTIAVLKYHVFDVEVMINRTIVYAVLSFVIVVAYVLVVLLVASAINEDVAFERYFAVAAFTLLIGLAINPLRVRLQRGVDEVLFSARANFRKTLTGAQELLQQALNRQELFRQLVKAVHAVVPSDLVAVYEARGTELSCTTFHGPVPLRSIGLTEDTRVMLNESPLLVRSKLVRGDRWLASSREQTWLSHVGFSLTAPLRTQSGELLALLALNPRIAHELYDEEELSFVTSVCSQAAEILERLRLQEKIILAQEEKRRSEELSNLKSYFVSSVSHELKTPLTSIRMFAEMLNCGAIPSARREKEYLEIIQGESERLARLIENILDFSKIERGVKEYNFAELRLEPIVKRAVAAMRYQFAQHKGRLRTTVQKGLPPLMADGDALVQALLNLLSNALKYSTGKKDVHLSVSMSGKSLSVAVADKGIGIPEAELPFIFERFYRVSDQRSRQVGGAGIGLALVKHIVEAHGGTASVTSKVGKGTTVTIVLPALRGHTRGKS